MKGLEISNLVQLDNMVRQKRYSPEKPRRCLGFFVSRARSRRERLTVDILDIAALI